jgi:hypothetical protein
VPIYYKRLKGPSAPPYFNFKLSISYRSLVTGKRYTYTGEVLILDNCSVPNQMNRTIENEQVQELPREQRPPEMVPATASPPPAR